MTRTVLILAVLSLFPTSSWAQVFRDSLVVYYAEGRTDIDMDLLDNRANINGFLYRYDHARNNRSTIIRSFKFDAFASPTSSLQTNIFIARKRAQKLYEFFHTRIGLPESVLEVTSHDVAWSELRRQVEKSDMPHKYEVLCVLMLPPKKVSDGKGRRVDHRKLMLMRMYAGLTWRYLYEHFFQAMRYSRVCIHFEVERGAVLPSKSVPSQPLQARTKPQPTPLASSRPAIEPTLMNIVPPKKSRFYGFVGEKKVFLADTLPQKLMQHIDKAVSENREPLSKKEAAKLLKLQKESEPKYYEFRRHFALKTNMLFDALSLLNAEVEVPVARRWSIMGEYMFPWWWYNHKRNTWWLWNQGQTAIEIISGSLETRYWFDQYNPRKAYTPLKGWFIGAFGGGGYYDLERKGKGYQGEFWMAGISGGYVRQLSRQWLLEFSLSTGYLHTDYRYYNAIWSDIDHRYHLIRQSNGSTSWFGPLKAKVSLVWYPLFRKRVKEKGGEE